LILNDFTRRALSRDFHGLRGVSALRDLNSLAKQPPEMARVSVWHLARYGFRVRRQAPLLAFGLV
jgi:hypothetical protein